MAWAAAGLLLLPPISHAATVAVSGSTAEGLSLAGAPSISQVSPTSQSTVGPDWITETLYDGSTLFTGISFTRIQLEITTPGVLRVQLTDLAFPSLAGLLTFSLVQGGDVAAILPAPGELHFEVAEPGRFFAYVYGVGAPGSSVASYYLNVTHSYIPLPAAVWLLLSGMLALGTTAYRRRAS
jgi:hypothetical protein